MDPTIDLRARRRAGTRLVTVALIVLALGGLVAAVLITRAVTAPPASPVTTAHSSVAGPGAEPGWDLAAEMALAERPMLALPAQAAQPHELTTQTAGPDITLPAPTAVAGQWIADGYPATAEGALAQLKALNEAGADGGDPATYARAYAQLALLGAPPVDRTALSTVLTHFRDRAGIPVGQPKPGLEVSYEITHGLIKGSTDGGRYTVVCTLGQLSFRYQGTGSALGIGDCQALRWTGAGWRI